MVGSHVSLLIIGILHFDHPFIPPGTTDAIFSEKPNLYDLFIDLTRPSPSRPHRPALFVSRQVEGSNGKKSYKLQTVRFTWSDVKLWNELERILEADMEHEHHSNANPSISFKSILLDPWRIYEDVCMICAGIWVGWKPNSSVVLGSKDDLLMLPSTSSDPAAGAGITPSADTGKARSSPVDPLLGKSPVWPTTRARVTALSLLSAFHNHTDFLLSKLSHVLSEPTSTVTLGATSDRSPSGPIVLSPKDVMEFEFVPGSDLDARFIEWLGETRGWKIKVRRGWKDLFGFIFGFP